MPDSNHIINVRYHKNGFFMTRAVYQYDYGQELQFEDFPNLPAAFEMHFASKGCDSSMTQIGEDGRVPIPDELLTMDRPVCGWLFLHDTDQDGETRYSVEIPVTPRSEISDIEPTPVQQSTIDRAIAAMNNAVNVCNSAVEELATVEAEAVTLPEGSEATATYDNGHLTIGVPTGATGATGPQGPKGDTGERGPKGDTGATGPRGEKGDTGERGPQGVQGIPGETGPQGEQGPKGDKGDKGDRGAQGVKGDVGNTGPQGPQGEPGPQGPKGEKGDSGASAINDNAGSGYTNAVWSANKLTNEFSRVAVVRGTGAGSGKNKEFSYVESNRTISVSNTASGVGAFAEGVNTRAEEFGSHAEGYTTEASGYSSHAEGANNTASGRASHAEGNNNTASASFSHVEGSGNTASEMAAHAEGTSTEATKNSSHAEGLLTKAHGNYSHAEGRSTNASGESSHAEGYSTTASGASSHAEGSESTASGAYSHAEGYGSTASSGHSHAEGYSTTASGTQSHAEGYSTTASGTISHAEGMRTVANHKLQHVSGQYNVEDPSTAAATSLGNYVDIVGNGTANSNRSNAYALDWNGNGYFAGDVYVNCDSDSTGGSKLIASPATEGTNGQVLTTDGQGGVSWQTPSGGGTVTDVQVNGTSILNNGVADIPIADANVDGLVRIASSAGLLMNPTTHRVSINAATSSQVKAQTELYAPITPNTQHESAFYGLAKAAGDSTQAASDNAVGTYTDGAKTAIREMIGAVGDVQVNGTSIVNNGVANIPIASANDFGVVKTSTSFGTRISADGALRTECAFGNTVKSGTNTYQPISPAAQHSSTFYGLSKVAGKDLASETVTLGIYPDASKGAIQHMLGVDELIAKSETDITVDNAYAVNEIFVHNGKLYKATSAIAANDVITPGTNCTPVKADEVFVKNTDYADSINSGSSNGHYGIVKVRANGADGLRIWDEGDPGRLMLYPTGSTEIKAANDGYKAVTTAKQHESVFYGLSKVAGVDLANETVTVGTYPATASAAIRTMLGAVGDSDFATSSTAGIVKINGNGLSMSGSSGLVVVITATASQIKAGVTAYNPITPSNQHAAAFYGLATAAGDTTQASSSNAVGTYTADAKAAIHTMLGIDPASIAAQVEIPLVETVTGTTPTITGDPNTRYVCGEVTEINITPPSSGSIDVIFESGSTATLLTVPNTVKFPAWFDATSLETNTIYEILITDGVYGSVMTWAA